MPQEIPIINRGFQELNPLLAGWEDCCPEHSYGPSVREYYLIHYVQSGKGILYNEDGVHPVEAGQIFLIRPGQVTTYTADKKNPWSYIWVGFDGRLTKKLDELGEWVISYPEDTFIRLRHARDLAGTREEYVTGLLFSMLSVLLDQETTPPGYQRQAADYIRANYMRDISVEDIARTVGLDRRYLSRIFKADMGVTMQEFLIQTRLEHSALYLKQGESVTQAAALSGYADVFHFSKMFKKSFGVSPREYRDEAKKHSHTHSDRKVRFEP